MGDINYYELGKRIRHYRKAINMSQESLADSVNISTTHLSHIETGNTKLSLQVLVNIAEVLSVNTDTLLFDNASDNKSTLSSDIANVIDSCSIQETKIIKDLIIATKESLRRNSDNPL